MTAIKTKIISIDEHTNAENLELVKVLGFQVVVAKSLYEVGQEVLYYEPELAFTLETAVSYNIDKYLSPKKDINNEKVLVIKEIKLRGELSEGLILPEQIACFKYQPPANSFSKTNSIPELKDFKKYSSLENLRKAPNLFELDSIVTVTEKIHGTNSRVGYYTNELGEVIFCVGSRQLTRELYDELYNLPLRQNKVFHFLQGLIALGYKSATLYGEIYGPKIQNYSYGESVTHYAAFTLALNNEICSPETFQALAKMANIPIAPVIYVGPYSYNKIKELSEGPSIIGPKANHKREGIVVQQGSTIAKLVSDTYLLKQKVSTTDL
jgi:hypothetical protein